MASFLEQLETLKIQLKGVEGDIAGMRAALEWLGATVQGQTEALDVVAEELTKVSSFEDLKSFLQKMIANHGARQEARRKAQLENSKKSLQTMIDQGMLTATDKVAGGTLIVGNVKKGDQVVSEWECGVFENFPPECQAAIIDQGPGATYDGPKGLLTVEAIYLFKKEVEVVSGLSEQTEAQAAPAVVTEITSAAQAVVDEVK